MANRKYDLTSGSILKKLLLVAVPIMGTQLMQMAYNLVDIAYMGRVGSAAVACSSAAVFSAMASVRADSFLTSDFSYRQAIPASSAILREAFSASDAVNCSTAGRICVWDISIMVRASMVTDLQ